MARPPHRAHPRPGSIPAGAQLLIPPARRSVAVAERRRARRRGRPPGWPRRRHPAQGLLQLHRRPGRPRQPAHQRRPRRKRRFLPCPAARGYRRLDRASSRRMTIRFVGKQARAGSPLKFALPAPRVTWRLPGHRSWPGTRSSATATAPTGLPLHPEVPAVPVRGHLRRMRRPAMTVTGRVVTATPPGPACFVVGAPAFLRCACEASQRAEGRRRAPVVSGKPRYSPGRGIRPPRAYHSGFTRVPLPQGLMELGIPLARGSPASPGRARAAAGDDGVDLARRVFLEQMY